MAKKQLEVESTPPTLFPKSTQDDETLSASRLYDKIQPLNLEEFFKKTESEHKAVPKPEMVVRQRKERPVLNQEQFDKQYGYRRVDLTLGTRVRFHYKKALKWKCKEWCRFLSGLIPITRWLPKYQWKEWILADIIGGCMCAIMSVPQGLAYGYMVGVPPNYGLITGIFGPLIYALLGTSRHTSPGSFAIVSLMVGSAVQKYAGGAMNISLNGTETDLIEVCCRDEQSEIQPAEAVQVAITMTLLVGVFQIVFALLNMGLLAVWLSDQLVQGLTSGAAIHVLTSQIKSMTGIRNLPPTNDPFSLPKFYICFGYHITDTDVTTIVVAAISVFLLLFSCYFVDPILKKWTKIKFPMEFLLVAGSVLLVWLSQGTRFQVSTKTVGHVESGLVMPMAPGHEKWGGMIGDSITTAVISFVIHISMAKMIAKKLNYEVDANQEWLALGSMHTFSSFFGCFAGGSSLGRSMTQVKFGTKTQLSTLICCCIMVGFVYGAATLIYFLPKAVLAAIVVIAMKDLYIQLFRSLCLFKQSYVDFLVFMVTLLSVIFVNVMFGLVIGVAFALLSVVFRTQWADSTCMGRIPGTADFKGMGHYRTAEELQGIKLFRFDSPLYFANAETFISKMYSACGVNPIQVKASMQEKLDEEKKRIKRTQQGATNEEVEHLVKEQLLEFRMKSTVRPVQEQEDSQERDTLTHIIMDCSAMPYIDLMGKDALSLCYQEYLSIGVTVLFAHCKIAVRQTFETTDFHQDVPKNRLFVSLEDAVQQAQRERRDQAQKKTTVEETNRTVENKRTERPRHIAPVALSPVQKTMVVKKMQVPIEIGGGIEPQGTQSALDLTASTTAVGLTELWEKMVNPPPPIEKSQDSMDKTQ